MLDIDAWCAANGNASLLIADGHNVTVNVRGGTRGGNGGPVEGGSIVITDGPMGDARKRVIPLVPRTFKHLIVLTSHGYVSLDAMKWLSNAEITWSIIDPTGVNPNTLATSGRFVNPVFMRRQAMCGRGMPAANTGVKIMRFLLTRKLEGQADNAERILRDNATAKFILEQTDKLAVAKDVNTLMGYEGEAAKRYWAAWGDLPVIWNGPKPLQSHWLAFPKRATLRRDYADNRNATDPINAMLNFGYACAESECTLAAYAAALDPAMGIGHVDEPGRNSFALDLIEVLRPFVDAIILGIMAEKLDRDHYAENKVGVVSCRVPLTHRIASEVHAAAIEVTKALFTVLPLLDSHQSRKAGIKSDSD